MEVAAFESGRIMSLVGVRGGILLYTYTDKSGFHNTHV